MKTIWYELFNNKKLVVRYYIKETIKHHSYIDKYTSTFSVYEDNNIGFDMLIDDGLNSLDDAKQTLAKYKERLERVGETIIKDV